ncbi:MAG: YqeG family HAD IIIA-type phosphatase [Bacillota bacterium]|nr:YqeG family HAD IIIA-type phosphatase [Bacillota bacterium]
MGGRGGARLPRGRTEEARPARRPWLAPDAAVERLDGLDVAWLRAHGVRGLIVDLDNTLTDWNEPELPAESRAWLARLREAGLRVCLLSNNRSGRVLAIARAEGLAGGVANAAKPWPGGFRRALACLGLDAGEVAVVGDQLFTDVLGGRLAGCLTVWVRPRSPREFLGTRLLRRLEALWLARLRRLGQLPAPGRPAESPGGPAESPGRPAESPGGGGIRSQPDSQAEGPR